MKRKREPSEKAKKRQSDIAAVQLTGSLAFLKKVYTAVYTVSHLLSSRNVPVTFPALRKDVQKLAGVDIAFKHIRQLVTVGHPGIQLQPLSLFARPIEPWNEDSVIYAGSDQKSGVTPSSPEEAYCIVFPKRGKTVTAAKVQQATQRFHTRLAKIALKKRNPWRRKRQKTSTNSSNNQPGEQDEYEIEVPECDLPDAKQQPREEPVFVLSDAATVPADQTQLKFARAQQQQQQQQQGGSSDQSSSSRDRGHERDAKRGNASSNSRTVDLSLDDEEESRDDFGMEDEATDTKSSNSSSGNGNASAQSRSGSAQQQADSETKSRSAANAGNSNSSSGAAQDGLFAPDLQRFLTELKKERFYSGQIRHVRVIPAREPHWVPLLTVGMSNRNAQSSAANRGNRGSGMDTKADSAPQQQQPNANTEIQPVIVADKVYRAVVAQGITKLFSHQAQAIHHVFSGRNVVISTPTSSGKSLAFNIPVLERLTTKPESRALYIFPTKALAQDQLRAMKKFIQDFDAEVQCATYDGDTPMAARNDIRDNAHIVMTNPDMLHVTVLPSHSYHARLLRNLSYVVLDETHVYKGVFGSHVALIIRRLRRLCDLYGSKPQFICCSATMANPAELATSITGLPVSVVSEDGSPSGEKQFILWNPPLVKKEKKQSKEEKKAAKSSKTKTKAKTKPKDKGKQKTKAKQKSGSSKGNAMDTSGTERKSGSSSGNADSDSSDSDDTEAGDSKSTAAANSAAQNDGKAAAATSDSAAAGEESKISVANMQRYVEGDMAEQTQERRSTHMETAILLAHLVQRNLKTIAFCKARAVTEFITVLCHNVLKSAKSTAPLVPLVKPYRAGYSAADRRAIEKQLFSGELRGVVSTNALELGIDIGSLDCTLSCGFPGSIASLWQQAGRSGRSSRASLSILIAYDSPLDQHFLRNPDDLFSRTNEKAVLNPTNPNLLLRHLLCAAHEQPLCTERDTEYFGDQHVYREVMADLLKRQWISLIGAGLNAGQDGSQPSPMSEFSDEYMIVPGSWSAELKNSSRGAAATGSEDKTRDATMSNNPSQLDGWNGHGQGHGQGQGQKSYSNSKSDRYHNKYKRHESGGGQQHHAQAGRPDSRPALSWSHGPANDVSIRRINDRVFEVIDVESGQMLDEIDEGRAYFDIFPGAIYLHQTKSYQVMSLDTVRLVAKVTPRETTYYTMPKDHTHVTVQHRVQETPTDSKSKARQQASDSKDGKEAKSESSNNSSSNSESKTPLSEKAAASIRKLTQHGRVLVNVSVFGMKKIHKRTQKILEVVRFKSYELKMNTQAFWVDIPEELKRQMDAEFKEQFDNIASLRVQRYQRKSAELQSRLEQLRAQQRQPNPHAASGSSNKGSVQVGVKIPGFGSANPGGMNNGGGKAAVGGKPPQEDDAPLDDDFLSSLTSNNKAASVLALAWKTPEEARAAQYDKQSRGQPSPSVPVVKQQPGKAAAPGATVKTESHSSGHSHSHSHSHGEGGSSSGVLDDLDTDPAMKKAVDSLLSKPGTGARDLSSDNIRSLHERMGGVAISHMDLIVHAIDFVGGLHGIAHCIIGLLPLYIMCDSLTDLSTECPAADENPYGQFDRPLRILIFERTPEGLGVAKEGAQVMPQLLQAAHRVISECPCVGKQGCPSCVQSPKCKENNVVTDKKAALWILRRLLGVT